jgi:hypothetical protein
MSKIKVLSGQSLFDLAIQTSGDATSAIAMSIANNVPVTESLQAADVVTAVAVGNRDITSYYKNKNLTPATALSGEMESAGIFDDEFNDVFA